MKTALRLKVLAFEGPCEISEIFYSVSSATFKSELTPLFNPKKIQEFEFFLTDTVKIALHSGDSQLSFSSVSFPLSILKSSIEWVPLGKENEEILLSNVPSPSSAPRVLIEIAQNDQILTESQIDHSIEAFESFVSEIALLTLIESPKMDSQDLLPEISAKYKKQSLIIKMLIKQLEILREKNSQLSSKIENLEETLAKANNEISRVSQSSAKQERNFIDTLQEKEAKVNKVLTEQSQLISKLRVYENEREHLLVQIKRLELEVDKSKYLENELQNAWLKVKKSEEIQEHLNKTIAKLGKNIQILEDEDGYNSQLLMKDQEILLIKSIAEEVKKSGDMQILSLKKEIEELKQCLLISQEQERYLAYKIKDQSSSPRLDMNAIDSHISEIFKRLNLSSPIKKLHPFVYRVSDQTLNLAIGKDDIFVVNSRSLSKIEDYLNHKAENSPAKKKDESFISPKSDKSLLKEPQVNTTITKTASQQNFLKATRSSLSKSKPVLAKTPTKDRPKRLFN